HAGHRVLVDLDPARSRAALRRSERRLDVRDLLALLADRDDVVRVDPIARDVHPLAVHEHVVVPNELAALRAAGRKPHPVHDVVEPALDEAQHLLTRTARQTRSRHVVPRELLLEQSVDTAHALLLAQAETVLAELDARLAMLAGRIRAACHRALVGEAALPLQVELVAVATADLANGSEVASHL